MLRRLLRKPVTWVALGVLALGFAFGLFWFQPWKLFTNKTVNDALPGAATAGATPGDLTPTPVSTSARAEAPASVLLAAGDLITHEHATSGKVSLIRLADGRVQLAIAALDTSDGPDLRVWLTDQPVTKDGWRVFDDGRWVELGRLRGNQGNQVYDVPAGTDLNGLVSVTIWCKRFAVSFGAADLRAA